MTASTEQKRNESLANDIKEFLIKNGLNEDVRIYFNNMCYDWCDSKDNGGEPTILKNIKGSEYFEYANDETVSMSFEGGLYSVLNHGSAKELEREFYNIFKNHQCYFELGYAWSLSVYLD